VLQIGHNVNENRHRFETRDTCELRTVSMNVTLSIDERLVAEPGRRQNALGKSLDQLIRDYLQQFHRPADSLSALSL